MKRDATAVLTKVAADVRERLRAMLSASPFRAPSTWARAVVIVTPERRTVMRRLGFAAELHASGLATAAHEAVARRVRAGEVLVYFVVDNADLADAGFVVVDLLGAR